MEIFSTRPLLLSRSLPEGGSLVSMYLSFRLSESMSVPFRFCSVIFDEDPKIIENTLMSRAVNTHTHLVLEAN